MSNTIKSLGQYVYDSIEGYRNAHDRAEDPGLKTAFAGRIEKREVTLTRLNQALATMGEDPVTSGSAAGTLHDMWGRVLASIGGNDQAVVSHVEEGEDFLKEQFEDALKDNDISTRERDVISACLIEVAEGEMFADALERATT